MDTQPPEINEPIDQPDQLEIFAAGSSGEHELSREELSALLDLID